MRLRPCRYPGVARVAPRARALPRGWHLATQGRLDTGIDCVVKRLLFDVTVSIAARAGDQELDHETILVLPVHKWLTNGHQHGPGAQVHAPDANDFWLDFDYLS